MATSDNVLTKLHDQLLYIIPQLGKFPCDQMFPPSPYVATAGKSAADRIQVKLMDVPARPLPGAPGTSSTED